LMLRKSERTAIATVPFRNDFVTFGLSVTSDCKLGS